MDDQQQALALLLKPLEDLRAMAATGGTEIYDRIMGGIEPELVTAVIPTLAAKYKDETPAQRNIRADRYDAAYAEYDRRFAAYCAELDEKAKASRRQAFGGAEAFTSANESGAIAGLESAIASQ